MDVREAALVWFFGCQEKNLGCDYGVVLKYFMACGLALLCYVAKPVTCNRFTVPAGCISKLVHRKLSLAPTRLADTRERLQLA